MKEITKETVKQLYWKYNDNPNDGRDGWDVVADIINELYPREEYKWKDANYYYHIHVIWTWLEEYIQSTYEEVEE